MKKKKILGWAILSLFVPAFTIIVAFIPPDQCHANDLYQHYGTCLLIGFGIDAAIAIFSLVGVYATSLIFEN